MRIILLAIVVCALAVIPAAANSNALVSQQLSTEARELKTLASHVAGQLKDKDADPAVASSRMEQITQRATEITRLIGLIDTSGLTLGASRQRELERLKMLSVTLNVYVENKRRLLETGGPAAQRSRVRSHAVGVATRADMIEKTVRKLGL